MKDDLHLEVPPPDRTTRALLRLAMRQARQVQEQSDEDQTQRESARWQELSIDAKRLRFLVKRHLGRAVRPSAWGIREGKVLCQVSGHWLGMREGTLVRVTPQGKTTLSGAGDLLKPPTPLDVQPVSPAILHRVIPRIPPLTWGLLGLLGLVTLLTVLYALNQNYMPLSISLGAALTGGFFLGMVASGGHMLLCLSGNEQPTPLRAAWTLLPGLALIALISVPTAQFWLKGGQGVEDPTVGFLLIGGSLITELIIAIALTMERPIRHQKAALWRSLSGKRLRRPKVHES